MEWWERRNGRKEGMVERNDRKEGRNGKRIGPVGRKAY